MFAEADDGPLGPAPFVTDMGSIGGGGSSRRISSRSDFMLSTLNSLSAVVCGSGCAFLTLFFFGGAGVFSILAGR